MYLLWIWIYLLQVLLQCSAEKDLQNAACRSYLGVHDRVVQYRFNSYSSCFIFLFYQLNPRINSNYTESQPVVDFIYKRQIKQLESWDYKNDTVKSNVCSFLSSDECQRWILCCEAADNCCEYQLALPVKTNDTCGRIWDGWLCWEEAEPGTVQYSSCPLFVPYFMPSQSVDYYVGQAVRICGDDGKWIQKTDYSPCLKKEELERTIFTGLGCSVTSIVFLLPSIIIFLKYKTLRNQHRIRLHINLFLSLMLKEVMEIMWDTLVTYNKVTSTEVSDATLIKNGVGCKFLSFLKIYFKCCGYTWMFCEGFYLHRLMSNAFSPPRSLLPIYILGWSVPLMSSSLYGILRGIYNNESCWAYGYNNFEWIFDAPNVVFLVLNLVFLTNILRILLTQLQAHPNEPGNFRKAVKATFILIPLFGIQLFVTIYRIPISEEGGLEYERVTVVVNHTQGFFVAMVFCFLNTEVISNLRRSCRHQIRDRSLSSSKRLNHTIHQTLSVRSEYDVTRDHHQSKNSLLETGQETEEIELKETSLLNGHRENKSLE